ncbi:MAG: LacI family transcriptional regulator [Spirochaetales bacterium]|nr:LacI family transcriptional regulator [Spirochaetales bacterium]
MKTTMQNIAELCGVSRGTVDRALNGRGGVNEETRRRIIRVASEVGYVPDQLAASLSTGKTNTIGIIVFDLAHTFFSELVSEMISSLRAFGFSTYVSVSRKDADEEISLVRHLAAQRVDGLIIVPIGTGRNFEHVLRSVAIPVVTVLNALSRSWPFVGIDDEPAIVAAVDHIVERGYRSIAYVSPPLRTTSDVNSYSLDHRARGFRAAVRKHDFAVRKIISGDDYCEQAVALHNRGGQKVAFLCSSDHFALNLLHHFHGLGVAVPRDVGIMGFDNVSILEYVRPRLTTVDINRRLIAKTSVEMLMNILKDQQCPIHRTISCSIVTGESL